MLIASENREPIPILPEGMYMGVCAQVIDLGVQKNPTFNTMSRKVRIVWEIPDEVIKIKDDEYPRRLSRDFTLSLSDNSNLRKMLQQWRGRTFTKEELKGFCLSKLLGVGAQLQVMHKEGRNGVYANVETVLPYPKGMKPPKVQGLLFDLDDAETYFVFPVLPRGIQKIISESEGFADTGLAVEENAKPNQASPSNPTQGGFHELPDNANNFDDDLPF